MVARDWESSAGKNGGDRENRKRKKEDNRDKNLEKNIVQSCQYWVRNEEKIVLSIIKMALKVTEDPEMKKSGSNFFSLAIEIEVYGNINWYEID